MNIIPKLLAAGAGAPQMLIIIYWLLLVLWAVGAFGFRDNPRFVYGSNVVVLILFAIIGYYTFGF